MTWHVTVEKGRSFWCCAFACLALPVCLALAVIVPIGEVADEGAHLARAVALTDGQFIGYRQSLRYNDGTTHVVAGVTIEPVWEMLSRSRPLGFGGTLIPVETVRMEDGRAFMPLYTIATYPPVLYAPGALGLWIGRSLGWPPTTSAYFGRVANATAYTILGLATLALATRARRALFTLLVLPMPLSLAASFNQDALIIALSALAAALLTPCNPVGRGKRFRLITASVIVAVVVLTKPPYAPLAAMLLGSVPWAQRFWCVCLHRLPLVALVIVPAALWTTATTAFVATPVPRPVYEAGPLWIGARPARFNATDPAAQARLLAAKPARLVTVPVAYLFGIKHLRALSQGMIGTFGWYDRTLPGPLYAMWSCILLLMMGDLRPNRWASIPERLLFTAASLICLWLIVVSQYLSWTNVGEDRVFGPQGRYLLPLAPMLVLAFAGEPSEDWAIRRWAAALPVLAAVVDLAALPLLALRG